jgi:hypothetical protein
LVDGTVKFAAVSARRRENSRRVAKPSAYMAKPLPRSWLKVNAALFRSWRGSRSKVFRLSHMFCVPATSAPRLAAVTPPAGIV